MDSPACRWDSDPHRGPVIAFAREEVLGRTSAEFGMWENPEERDLAWKDMCNVGSIRQRECRWLDRRGEPFTILLSAEIIQFNDTPHILSLALDITQRKRAEEELRKTLEREKELSQLKSNFVSMVSHEFRTPLGIIQSSAELLREFFKKMQPSEREEQLESITRNTRRMAGMMEEILVLSRLDSGNLEFRPSPLDLETFCRRVVDEVNSATHRRCSIQLSVASALPKAYADEQLLGHIFTNLLSNAVKYSEAGASVQFKVGREDANACCIIRDEGIGISEDDQNKLFTAFYRGANVGSRSGTGRPRSTPSPRTVNASIESRCAMSSTLTKKWGVHAPRASRSAPSPNTSGSKIPKPCSAAMNRRPRGTKSADKSDAVQTLRASGRVSGPRVSVWSACVFSAAFPRQAAIRCPGQPYGEPHSRFAHALGP